ncbi:blue light sensor protein [Roseovarius sp. TE539]|uniref:BLUF domain-containing protein n=1 Tax=Roseovarius sp. TE539 TaxID=2249812 RepID=UPI000DDDB768|nr:BLUF domain-containing protein [Roseovarius sp. TE539]RBI69911.1 blue light sensor protein [Roseovarius sp. TE539]
MQLARLIYASTHDGLAIEAVDRILQKSRANNERDGITGALIVGERSFMQLLEGDRSRVAACFMRIMQDDRHRDIRIILAGDVENRSFLEWSMHLINASRIKEEILSRYLIDGQFDPARMSEAAIKDLCQALSAGDWEKEAA